MNQITGVFIDPNGRWYEVRTQRPDGQEVILHGKQAEEIQRQCGSRPPDGAFVSSILSMSPLREGKDDRKGKFGRGLL